EGPLRRHAGRGVIRGPSIGYPAYLPATGRIPGGRGDDPAGDRGEGGAVPRAEGDPIDRAGERWPPGVPARIHRAGAEGHRAGRQGVVPPVCLGLETRAWRWQGDLEEPQPLLRIDAVRARADGMDKLIITVAPTGSVPRKKDTPHVPVTPDEIAETAYRCEQEGAAIIHVHCRDENERPTSRFDIFRESVDTIRKRTMLVVMTSTSRIAGQTDERRAIALTTNPESGSLTTGTRSYAGRQPPCVYPKAVHVV